MEFYEKDKSIGTNVGKVLRALRQTLQHKFEESGNPLTLEQWLVLMLLKRKDGQPQNELSYACEKEKTTITRIIDGLEKRNLIVRVQDKTDRRSNLIYLTDAGREVEKILTPIGIEVNRIAVQGFADKEIALFNSMLKRIYDNLQNEQVEIIDENNVSKINELK
jgi:DNA-binding MarR family transcriptional regulator